MRQFTYISGSKTVTYKGWDRNVQPQTEFIALVRDEDSIDVLAIDDPSDLDGVMTFIADEPCTELLGIWRRHTQ